MGPHQAIVSKPVSRPVSDSVQNQAKKAEANANRDHVLESRDAISGSNTAHQSPNRMCEMNREALRPPKGAPSTRSRKTMVAVAATALKAAQRRTRSMEPADREAEPRAASSTKPPTARGSFTRTSWRARAPSRLQNVEAAESATNANSAKPDSRENRVSGTRRWG